MPIPYEHSSNMYITYNIITYTHFIIVDEPTLEFTVCLLLSGQTSKMYNQNEYFIKVTPDFMP